MELNAFMRYPNEGIARLVNPFGHEQYPSKNLNKNNCFDYPLDLQYTHGKHFLNKTCNTFI
jgi:hypothetical protein